MSAALIARLLIVDDTPELRIVRLPHLAHAAFAEQQDDFVGAEFIAGLQLHMRRRSLQSL